MRGRLNRQAFVNGAWAMDADHPGNTPAQPGVQAKRMFALEKISLRETHLPSGTPAALRLSQHFIP